MKTVYWRLIPLAVFASLAFSLAGIIIRTTKIALCAVRKRITWFSITGSGRGKLFTPQLMQGQVALLNVWASWCAACVDEQVFLMRLAREGVPIYGLNYKDNPENAQRWLNEWGNPYQAVGEDTDGKVAIDLGIYGAPETFLIDQKGLIRFRHPGILDEESWKTDFLPRIKQLKGDV